MSKTAILGIAIVIVLTIAYGAFVLLARGSMAGGRQFGTKAFIRSPRRRAM